MAALEGRSIDEVLGVHELHECPRWSLWEGTRIAFSCNSDSIDESTMMLKRYLQVLKDSGTYTIYQIKWHELQTEGKNKKISNSAPYFASFGFRLNEQGEVQALPDKNSRAASYNAAVTNQLLDLQNQKHEFELQKLNEKYQRELEELCEEEDEYDKMGKIAGIIGKTGEQYPWLQEIIKDVVNVVKNIIPQHQQTQQLQPVKISGMPQNNVNSDEQNKQLINAAIKKMAAYYTNKYGSQPEGDSKLAADLSKLATLTDKPFIFDMAVKNLNNL